MLKPLDILGDGTPLNLPGAKLRYFESFFNKNEADNYFSQILDTTVWQQDKIKVTEQLTKEIERHGKLKAENERFISSMLQQKKMLNEEHRVRIEVGLGKLKEKENNLISIQEVINNSKDELKRLRLEFQVEQKQQREQLNERLAALKNEENSMKIETARHRRKMDELSALENELESKCFEHERKENSFNVTRDKFKKEQERYILVAKEQVEMRKQIEKERESNEKNRHQIDVKLIELRNMEHEQQNFILEKERFKIEQKK